MQVKVEVCATSREEAVAAMEFGLDSVELCSWTACGGTTPSTDLVGQCMSWQGGVLRVLVRPVPGDFLYGPRERAMLSEEMQVLLAACPDVHIVSGALDKEGMPQREVLQQMLQHVPGVRTTFHRAIDHVKQPLQAMDRLLEAGISRVLSSGGAERAASGVAVLGSMVKHGGSRITIAAAGSIGPEDVVAIVEATGVGEVHFMARRPASLTNTMGGQAMEPDRDKIDGVLNALAKAGLR